MVQVCLVHMPYSGLERPSLALGLLKAYLSQRHIPATVVYANLDFASMVGVDVYRAVEETPAESLIGEWTFARAAFPDAVVDEHAFLASVADRLARFEWFAVVRRLHPHIDCQALLTAIRACAPAWIDKTARDIVALGPRIVGCTSTFQQHCASLALLRRIKALSPETVTMIGGANCEGVMGETASREFPWLDFVMSGEVDDFFGAFCASILAGGAEAAARRAPEGVFAQRERPRSVVRLAAPRAVLKSLDEAAVPDYDDYFAALDAAPFGRHISPALLFESSRGCWWGMKHHCTFCGLNGEGMTFRSKSPQRVLDELATLRARYGVKWVHAVDNIIDVKHLTTVLPTLVADDRRPYLFYEVKANLRREQVALLGTAGVRRIQPGIESMHDGMLQLLDKGNRWFTNVQLLKWSQQAGINVFWNFLAGAPGECVEWHDELAEWLPLVYHLEPPGSDELSMIRFDRFSPYHNTPDKYGLSLVPNQAYAQVYPVSNAALRDLAYFFKNARDESLDGASRPAAYRAIERSLAQWRRAFAGADGARPARLLASDSGGRLVIRDTRPIAVAETYAFEGLDRMVLQACESALAPQAVADAVRSQGVAASADEVADSVTRLKQLHLLLEWRGKIVSLHVNEPIVPYLTEAECPGYVDRARLFRALSSGSFAQAAVVSPYELPLEQWLAAAADSRPTAVDHDALLAGVDA